MYVYIHIYSGGGGSKAIFLRRELPIDGGLQGGSSMIP